MVYFVLCALVSNPLHLDASLLPIDQLPVQLTLYFTRPPAPVVTTYVSEICRAEGIQPDEHCFVDHLESVVDLRQCINQCQLGTSPLPPATVHLRETPRNHREDILEKYTSLPRWKLPRRDESQHKALWCLSKLTDTISYLDSRLVLRVDTVSESLILDNLNFTEPFGRRIGHIHHRRTMNWGIQLSQPVT